MKFYKFIFILFFLCSLLFSLFFPLPISMLMELIRYSCNFENKIFFVLLVVKHLVPHWLLSNRSFFSLCSKFHQNYVSFLHRYLLNKNVRFVQKPNVSKIELIMNQKGLNIIFDYKKD